MNDDDRIIQIPESEIKSESDRKFVNMINNLNREHHFTVSVKKQIDAEIALQKTNPVAYRKIMEERYGKDWDKSDAFTMQPHAVCTDFVKNTWENVGDSSFYDENEDDYER